MWNIHMHQGRGRNEDEPDGNMSNDVGTVLFGPDAVKMGLIDEIGGLSRALEKLRELAENNGNREAKKGRNKKKNMENNG